MFATGFLDLKTIGNATKSRNILWFAEVVSLLICEDTHYERRKRS